MVEKKRNVAAWFLAILVSGGVAAAIVEFILPKLWPENKPPQAQIVASSMVGSVSEVFVFDGASSIDPEGRPLRYIWTIDGTPVRHTTSLRHEFSEPGEHRLALTVTDERGLKNTTAIIIHVTPVKVQSALEALKDYKYEFGWSGNPVGSPDTRIEYHMITDVIIESDTFVVLKYTHRNGVLRMTVSKRGLVGTWADGDLEQLSDQKRGELGLTFVDDSFGRATGWWNYGGERQRYNAYLRRVE